MKSLETAGWDEIPDLSFTSCVPWVRNFVSLSSALVSTYVNGVKIYLLRAVGGISETTLAQFLLHSKYSVHSQLPFPLRYTFASSQIKSTLRHVYFLRKAKRHIEWRGKAGSHSTNRCSCQWQSHSLLGTFCQLSLLSENLSLRYHLMCMLGGLIEEPYYEMKWSVMSLKSWRLLQGEGYCPVQQMAPCKWEKSNF